MSILRNKFFLLIILLAIGSTSANSQSFKDRHFLSFGFSIYTDFMKLPGSYYILKGDDYSSSGTVVDTIVRESDFALSLFTLNLTNRITLKELSTNSSLALDVPLSLGLHISSDYFMGAQMPVLFTYNYGNVSTYSADKNKGVSIGLGFEMTKFLFGINDDKDNYKNVEYIKKPKSFFIGPVAQIAYRYWNKNNRAREFNVKLGYLQQASEKIVVNNSATVIEKNYFSLKLTFIIYPRY